MSYERTSNLPAGLLAICGRDDLKIVTVKIIPARNTIDAYLTATVVRIVPGAAS